MMKAGKLSEAALKRSVIRQLHSTRPEVLTSASIGLDYAAIQPLPGEAVVCAVGTMPLATAKNPSYTVYNALNNIACSGAKPIGILVNLLFPTAANEQDIRDVMRAVETLCEAEKIQVLGGHTEVIRSVTEPILTVTALGSVRREARLEAGRVKPGMDILVTKWIGMAGTAILAGEYEEALRSRYAQPFIDSAKAFDACLSLRPEMEALCGEAQGLAAAAHDISEGGIYGALWEMAQCSGVGLEIDSKKIPIRQETVEVCEFFDLNPYKLLSTGSMLIASDEGNALVRRIESSGGNAVVIGKATEGNDRLIVCGDEKRFLETTQTDELWHIRRKTNERENFVTY